MIVNIGTTEALEAYDDADGIQRFRPVEGERVTTFQIPDGTGPMEAFQTVVGGLATALMAASGRPHWIESDDELVAQMLRAHFGLSVADRPVNWGDGTTSTREALEAVAVAEREARAIATNEHTPTAPLAEVPNPEPPDEPADEGEQPEPVDEEPVETPPEDAEPAPAPPPPDEPTPTAEENP